MFACPFLERVRSDAGAVLAVCLAMAGVSLAALPSRAMAQADYVIHMTVDGLRPDAITTLGPSQAPNFYRLRTAGAFTDNARTDYANTNTLPNHASMLTGRPVLDSLGAGSGHRWEHNGDATSWGPPAHWNGAQTIQQNAGYDVRSAYSVAGAGGLTTGLYATKERFVIYQQSWAADLDNSVIVHKNSTSVLGSFLGHMGAAATRSNYSFLSFHDPDSAGHDHGWSLAPGSQYLNAVKTVDGYLGQIFDLIANDPALSGRTAIILSADHGGPLGASAHSTATDAASYTIPFYAWGAGVTAGDLYAMNAGTRLDPLTGRPLYSDALQPIRNGDGGNLAMDLLGLGAIPGSRVNADQSLVVPEPASAALLVAAAGLVLARRRTR
jgi:hypothetical protein